MSRVQVGVHLLNHGEVCRASIFIQIFEIEGQSVVAGKRIKKLQEFLSDLVTTGRILDNVAHGRIPALRVGVEVVEVGKDFGIFPHLLDDAFDLVVFVRVMDDAALKDGEFMSVGGGALQIKRGRIEVEPLGEEQIKLVNVLLQRRVAGCVGRDIVGGAQSFPGIKRNIGGLAIGFAPRGMERFLAARGLNAVLQCPVGVLLSREQQLGQRLATEYIEDEASKYKRGNDRGDVEYAAQALPSCSLGIEKYLFIEHRKCLGIQYESYGS
jgi:hypothetical protein